MINLQVSTDQFKEIPHSLAVDLKFQMDNVAEIIIGPRGVGIRHRQFDRSNPDEYLENRADVRWLHRHSANDVKVTGNVTVHHMACTAGVIPLYIIGRRSIVITQYRDGRVQIRVIGRDEQAVKAERIVRQQFAIMLNGSAPMDANSGDLDGAIEEATKLIAAAPGRGNEVRVFVKVADQLAGPVWQNVKV